MGDMADFVNASGGDDLYDIDDFGSVCKYCGKRPVFWVITKSGWRLVEYEPSNPFGNIGKQKIHKCKEYKRR